MSDIRVTIDLRGASKEALLQEVDALLDFTFQGDVQVIACNIADPQPVLNDRLRATLAEVLDHYESYIDADIDGALTHSTFTELCDALRRAGLGGE